MPVPDRWECPKCGSQLYETGQILTAEGFWSSFFDIGTRKFEYCVCTQCTYSEFYKGRLSKIQKAFDFLGSN